MEKFYKVRKKFKYTGLKLSNLDYYYGPWESINLAVSVILGIDNGENLISNHYLELENKLTPGFTIGVYENDNTVEYWWYKERGSERYDFVQKIEKYELVLTKFTASLDPIKSNQINISYKINGKGLLPKVSISGTNILQQPVNFGEEVTFSVEVNTPGLYSYTINVFDAIGTTFNSNNIPTTVTVSYGDVTATFTNSKIKNISSPVLSEYENKEFGVRINYNYNSIQRIWLKLNNSYIFYDSGEPNLTKLNENGVIDLKILKLPEGDNLYLNENKIIVYYQKKGLDSAIREYVVDDWSFNILTQGQWLLKFPYEFPEFGYENTNLVFWVNPLYGGGPDRTKTLLIKINNEVETISKPILNVNTISRVLYKLRSINGNNDLENITIHIKLEGTDLSEDFDIQLRKSLTPTVPYGDCYFNAFYTNVLPVYENLTTEAASLSFIDSYFPQNPNQTLPWNSGDTPIKAFKTGFTSFNLDMSIKTSLTGYDDTLIKICLGANDILIIGKLQIKSSLFNYNNVKYQTNNLALPLDGEYVHIGFGHLRLNNGKFYSCIFINGEIVFCSPELPTYSTSEVIVYFLNGFDLKEFCFTGENINTELSTITSNLQNSINKNGIPYTDYVLGEDINDIFYYNWKTTQLGSSMDWNSEIQEFCLVPFKIKDEKDEWETALLNKLSLLGKPIKKLKNFIKFGQVRHGVKGGVLETGEMFSFNNTDKENDGKDKTYAVICKYSLGNSNFDVNKYCIVQIQGTSTIKYPIPNFLFTFIEYKNNDFFLDNTVKLLYNYPTFTKLELNNSNEELEFEQKEISGETNLVAKADSMDSSHLNNTPTCIYFNSLVEALNSDGDNFRSFKKFDDTYLDAIVGAPIILKIDARDTIGLDGSNLDHTVDTTSILYNSYGTFMLNTGKSSKSMGLDPYLDEVGYESIFSIEGQSNALYTSAGSPGLFILPEDTEDEDIHSLYLAFDKLDLNYDNNKVAINGIVNLSEEEKQRIINFLVSSESFESRSTIDDDEIRNLRNWDAYAKPILRMWLFVAKSTDAEFKAHFDKVFNKEYAILYYINLLLFGQADNLGKNMMLDAKLCDLENLNSEVWYIRPYDLDSQLGLNNNGYDNIPIYACLSREHFLERMGGSFDKIGQLYPGTLDSYNSSISVLWIKFWKAFKEDIILFYKNLRHDYITLNRLLSIGLNIVSDKITTELYNIDFSLKHLGTIYSYLNKGGRKLNYNDWITKRLLYIDSYFSNFDYIHILDGNDSNVVIGETLIPCFYEFNYLAGKTRYGLFDFDFVRDSGLRNFVSGLTYPFEAMADSILRITPIWGLLELDVNERTFKNLQEYTGSCETYILHQDYYQNYKSISLININILSSVTNNKYVPNSVRILKLSNLTFNNASVILDPLLSNIEEIYLDNCVFNNSSAFILDGFSLLNKVIITNSVFNGGLTLKNLNLGELYIDSYSKINGTLILGGTITRNKTVDLSGIQCMELTFQNAEIEELYLDLLYIINGEEFSGYKFGDTIEITSDSIDNQARLRSNIKINDEYVYMSPTSGNFYRKSPKILEDLNDQNSTLSSILNLSGIIGLKLLSCIGFTNLIKILNLPTSVKTLNLLYCKNLTHLNDNTVNGRFNFNGLSNLKSKPYNYIVLGYVSGTATYSTYTYYYGKNFNVESFNLMGCEKVREIYKITNSTLDSVTFTGDYFVSGCMNLENFSLCTITFKSLTNTFKMTEKLHSTNGLNGLTFNITENTSVECAFGDSNIDVNIVLLRLGNVMNLNAESILSGSRIKNDIGTEQNPIIINWKECYQVFNLALHRNFNSVDYEGCCITNVPYGKLEEADNNIYNVYIKLPYAKSVQRMFVQQNIKLNTDVFVINGNYSSSIENVSSFLAYTKQTDFIDFSGCSKLTNLSFCYAYSDILVDPIDIDTPNSHFELKLPTDPLMNVTGLFEGVNFIRQNGNINISGIFNGYKINNARSCFKNTYCNCTGSPFDNRYINNVQDISSMFGIGTSEIVNDKGTISNFEWITSNMIASNITISGPTNGNRVESVGVFEGKKISNLINFDFNYSTTSNNLARMFRNSTILSFASGVENFVIKAPTSKLIFEGAIFSSLSNPLILIGPNVTNLSYGFKGCSGGRDGIDILFSENNNIKNLSYCFAGCQAIELKKESEYEDLTKLEDASFMFSALYDEGDLENPYISPLITLPTEVIEGINKDITFRNSGSLKNINQICFNWGNDKILNFEDCSNITTMEYAFYKNTTLPKLPNSLGYLTSMKGAFREGTSDNPIPSYTLSGLVNLLCADEAFAEYTITNPSNNVNDNIKISLDDLNNLRTIHACLTKHGTLSTSGLQRSLIYAYLKSSSEIPVLVIGESPRGTILYYTRNGWNCQQVGSNNIVTQEVTKTYTLLNITQNFYPKK